jgi:hypothetical protein
LLLHAKLDRFPGKLMLEMSSLAERKS